MRVARGSTATIVTDPFDGLPSSVSVTCTDALGNELTPAPVATVVGNAVSIVLTAAVHTAELDRLELEVSATVDSVPAVQALEVEVIGSQWLTLGALRAEPDLADSTRFGDRLLTDVRDEWCSHVEALCNLRMVPGYDVEHHRGRGLTYLVVGANEPTSVRAVYIDGELVDSSRVELDQATGFLELSSGSFPRGAAVEVHLENGLAHPPARLVRELKKVVRAEVLQRGAKAPTNAIAESSPEGGVMIRYSTPDPSAGRWTGFLSLDPVIAEYRRPAMGIA